MTEEVLMDYKELSSFLLKEAIKLTENLLDLMKENNGKTPFYFSGTEIVIRDYKNIGEYLKYASIAYELWEPETK